MSRTVSDILTKITEIDNGVEIIKTHIDEYGMAYPGQEPLWQAIDLLDECKLLLLNTKV